MRLQPLTRKSGGVGVGVRSQETSLGPMILKNKESIKVWISAVLK